MCSATSEAFGAAWTLSAPTEHAKSEEEGRRTSEPLDSLLCVHWFSTHSVPSFPAVILCSTGMRLVVMSVQDELIVCLVMPRCMFSVQLYLSEIVKFCFD